MLTPIKALNVNESALIEKSKNCYQCPINKSVVNTRAVNKSLVNNSTNVGTNTATILISKLSVKDVNQAGQTLADHFSEYLQLIDIAISHNFIPPKKLSISLTNGKRRLCRVRKKFKGLL